MANDNQPYGIGSDIWPGLAKLMEEMGELQQVLGKIMACEGKDAIYWDGSSLVPHLIEELGDVRAAMIFFCEANGLSKADVHARADEKLEKFRHWHAVRSGQAGGEDLLWDGLTEYDPRVIRTLLLLVDGFTMPSLQEIWGWDQATRHEVGEWAALTHLAASDNPVDVPDMPAVLSQTSAPEACPTCGLPPESPGEGRYCGSCQDYEGHCAEGHCMSCGGQT